VGNVTEPWPREVILDAARAVVLGEGRVTEGFRGIEVRNEGDRLVVEFRWRRDPNTYLLRFPFPDGVQESPEYWAEELAFLLMEELDTGLVRRSGRTPLGDGLVELKIDGAPDVMPSAYYVGDVPLDAHAGWFLDEAGLVVRESAGVTCRCC
jgi:hypothetical protein